MKDPVTFYPGGESAQEDGGGSDSSVLKARSSRRAFIKGIIASGAVAGSSTFIFGGLGGCSSDQPTAGTIERLISLNVNGQVRRVDVLPNETLAMTLCYKLGLTGTKLACDRGVISRAGIHQLQGAQGQGDGTSRPAPGQLDQL